MNKYVLQRTILKLWRRGSDAYYTLETTELALTKSESAKDVTYWVNLIFNSIAANSFNNSKRLSFTKQTLIYFFQNISSQETS